MDHSISQLDTKTTLNPDRFKDYETGVRRSPIFEKTLSALSSGTNDVCDVGGATGYFLQGLLEQSPHKVNGTVLEVVPEYKEQLCHKDIKFTHGSILNCELASNSFDIVVARHVLHHLVAKNLHETRKLQLTAIEEMIRLCRPGGKVIVYEQTNEVPIFSLIVFYLSLWFNKWGIKIRTFETGNVVVGFLSSGQITELLQGLSHSNKIKIISVSSTRRKLALKWRLTLLLAFSGDILFKVSKE